MLPPDGGLGAEPPMGVQGATPPASCRSKLKNIKSLKKYNFNKIIFWGKNPLAPMMGYCFNSVQTISAYNRTFCEKNIVIIK